MIGWTNEECEKVSTHNQMSASTDPGTISASEAEHLRTELERLRTESARLIERQRRIMELIGTTQPEHLVHDLRNILNERELLRTLAEGKY